jgi:hypothetical protein
MQVRAFALPALNDWHPVCSDRLIEPLSQRSPFGSAPLTGRLMTNPTVLVLTGDLSFADALQAEIEPALRVATFSDSTSLLPKLAESLPWMLVADIRHPSLGGHTEARMLELAF